MNLISSKLGLMISVDLKNIENGVDSEAFVYIRTKKIIILHLADASILATNIFKQAAVLVASHIAKLLRNALSFSVHHFIIDLQESWNIENPCRTHKPLDLGDGSCNLTTKIFTKFFSLQTANLFATWFFEFVAQRWYWPKISTFLGSNLTDSCTFRCFQQFKRSVCLLRTYSRQVLLVIFDWYIIVIIPFCSTTKTVQQKRISGNRFVQIIETGTKAVFPANRIVHLIESGRRKEGKSKDSDWLDEGSWFEGFLAKSADNFDEETKFDSQFFTSNCWD